MPTKEELIDSVLKQWRIDWGKSGAHISDETVSSLTEVLRRAVPENADHDTVCELTSSEIEGALDRDEEWAIQAAKECGLNLVSNSAEPIWPLSWVEAYDRLKAALPTANVKGLRGIARLFDDERTAKNAREAARELARRRENGLFPQEWLDAAGDLSASELSAIMTGGES